MSSGQRAAGRIFISHSSANSAIALAIVEAIEAKGMACWYAPREVRFGEDWADELASALDHCASLVVLLSAESIKSPHVAKEVQQAASRRVPIFPARIENVTPTGKLAYYTSETQWCNAFGTGRDMAIENLVMALRARLSGETMPPTKIPKSLYDPPPAATSLLPPLTSDEALRLYVGPAAERYLVAWRRMARRQTSMDWKWPAFLVQGYWAGYRRLVLPGLVTAVVLGLALGILGGFSPGDAPQPWGGIAGIMLLVPPVWLGVFGVDLYRRQAERAVARFNKPGADAAMVRDELKAQGGASLPLGIGLGFVTLLVAALLAAAIEDGKKTDTTTTTTTDTMTAPADTVDAMAPASTAADAMAPASTAGDAMAAAPAASAAAEPMTASTKRTVRLVNNSSQSIKAFYARVDGSAEWSADVLVGSLNTNQTRDFDFDTSNSCLWEFKAVYESDAVATDKVDVCKIGSFTYG